MLDLRAYCSLTCLRCPPCQIPAAVEDLIGGKLADADMLPINGSQEEVTALREALLARRVAEKAEKLAKKVPPPPPPPYTHSRMSRI